MMGRRRNAVYLNIGSVDEPEMSEPYSIDHFRMIQPFPYDINGDGRADLINGYRFMLNTGEDELENMWDRQVYWGMGLNSISALYDFDDDGVLDLVKGIDLNFIDGGRWRFDQYQLTEAGWRDSQFFGYDFGEFTPDDWTECRALKVVEMFEEDSPCLLKVVYSEFNAPRHRLTLLEDINDGDRWNWQPVRHFFDDVIDTNLVYQTPSFGDLDSDGDQDMAMLEGAHSDSLGIVFYQLRLDDREPSWEVLEDWGNGLDTVSFTMVSFADLDLDGDLDLVGTYLTEDRQERAILFQNTGDRNSPEWRYVQDAFAEGGPETEAVILTADVNGDGLQDILTERLCYINATQHSVHTAVLTPVLFTLNTFPNPFNSTTTIQYSLPTPSQVTLGIHDLEGCRIAMLVDEFSQEGIHRVNLNASDLPTGLYFINLNASGRLFTRKLVLIK
ncbi:MAG: T9SS type A sorting domain-containing protein [Candidatus Hatepunaea meridiana]|nr:T9SS type A sorting domain-containing protein [Candidatus Hatepunaea meridiana]